MVYSAHVLIHLPEDALRHGALDSFSCVPYESVMRLSKFGTREIYRGHGFVAEKGFQEARYLRRNVRLFTISLVVV